MFDTPTDRIKEVTLGLSTSPALSHVLLGAFMASLIKYIVPNSFWSLVISGVLWIIAVILYSIADWVTNKIEEEKKRVLDKQTNYYGIE